MAGGPPPHPHPSRGPRRPTRWPTRRMSALCPKVVWRLKCATWATGLPHCNLTRSCQRAGLFLGSLPVCLVTIQRTAHSYFWAGVQSGHQALGKQGARLRLTALSLQPGNKWSSSWVVAQPVRAVRGLCSTWRGPPTPDCRVSPPPQELPSSPSHPNLGPAMF